VAAGHSSIIRWAIRFLPLLEKVFRNRKHAAGKNWRMHETYIGMKGARTYLYRAVDAQGKTVDFLFAAKRDASAVEQDHLAIKCVIRSMPGFKSLDRRERRWAASYSCT